MTCSVFPGAGFPASAALAIVQAEVNRQIGSRIRQRRSDLGLSQRQIARRVGITLDQLDVYENGLARVSADCILKLAGVLAVPIAWFFSDYIGLGPMH